jgi:hypothetical protein
MEVRTRNDMDRMRGEGSARSFWKVLIDSKRRSEFVDALHKVSLETNDP